ncbi:carboxypeptidase Y [Cordyceps fumosorosea ARSEF 2679]|uniref:Carboxypeptidase n=1 Tax=Cordyceps fumosorosea (strain ARSEF 2679) TaxID=1081104 RepID=A0A168BAT6_CORFA|nr:carboxypeptidase Y [Cordyceps fumosorosea ARSEF 2679]OAA69860.1 carboxypeptidase Y [Cordyceps fumosorosea ARSEF 2679]
MIPDEGPVRSAAAPDAISQRDFRTGNLTKGPSERGQYTGKLGKSADESIVHATPKYQLTLPFVSFLAGSGMMKLSVSALFTGLLAASANAAGSINRVPDNEWDHILHGSDILSRRDGETVHTDAYLADYSMRSRIVDPSALGVDTVKQLSGYIDDNEQDKHLFFWFFESRNDPANDPVVLWLNGGPGCSSMLGLFTELGPSRISRSTGKPEHNAYAWNNNASVIFVDQPVNAGFSYSGRNEGTSAASARDLYSLLAFFFQQYPQYAKQDFHIAGESYAGHYIPLAAKEILSHQGRVNLKSVLIGNGLTDPLTQYEYYRPTACGEGGYQAVMPQQMCQQMDQVLPQCLAWIGQCYKTEDVQSCQWATDVCNRMSGIYAQTGLSYYDIRKQQSDPEPPELNRFLNDPQTMKAIGVERKWGMCNFEQVYNAFLKTGDWMKPGPVQAVPDVLAQVPVLVYAGDTDYICNWLGNQAWTKALEWPGKAAFNSAQEQPLRLAGGGGAGSCGKEYGKVTRAGNLSFMRIYGAGHMVPEDQPEAALDFFNRWIGGEWSK